MVQKLPKPVRPVYPIDSVDRALRLIQILRDRGEVRLRTAAAELGVAESTVHRIMAMLIYRGFAVQDDSRAYRPGPAIDTGLAGSALTEELLAAAEPPMERLAQQTGETCNLAMRVGTRVHMLHSAEGDAPLHVIARTGAIFPVTSSATGIMLLAGLADDQVRTVCEPVLDEAAVGDLLRRLALHRRSGYATSSEGTEREVSAVAVAVHGPEGHTVAALGIAVPTSRFQAACVPELVRLARLAQLGIERDLLEAASV